MARFGALLRLKEAQGESTMKSIYLLLVLKLLGLAGAVMSTAGVLAFFFFEGLAPHRWWLLGVGLGLIAVTEAAARPVLKQMRGSGAAGA